MENFEDVEDVELSEDQKETEELAEKVLDILNEEKTHPSIALNGLFHALGCVIDAAYGSVKKESREEFKKGCFAALKDIAAIIEVNDETFKM